MKKMPKFDVPEFFISKTFTNFVADSEAKLLVLDSLILYASNFEQMLDGGSSLVIAGPISSGKSFLAISILNSVSDYGYSVKYAPASKLLQHVEISEIYQENIGHEKLLTGESIDELVDCDLLVLDDVGSHIEIGIASAISEIICRRYDEQKPTIVATSLTLFELTEFLGIRVIDRLRENGGKYIPCDWNAYGKARA